MVVKINRSDDSPETKAIDVSYRATTNDTKPTVSIVCPFYNESGIVHAFYAALRDKLDQLPDYLFEIVCVDDGSSDQTLDELLELSAQDRRIRVVELSRNFGKEAALSAGLDVARGDFVITIDADLQDPPELIRQLLEARNESDADVVLAQRIDRRHDSRAKRATASAYYSVHNWLSPVKIPRNVGDCRLMTRQVVEALSGLPETQRFMKGLFAWVGFRTVAIEYQREPRFSGRSKFSWWRLWNFGIEGITSFSTLPLRIWMYIGMTGAFVTLCYAVYFVFRTLMHGVDVPGYASLLVSILFFGSLQLIGLGVLGEYVGRIYTESKRRPTYLVRKIHGLERKS
ncbi:MAG: glycosyltransferase family 2 protein [Burkholderiaceae bacterium]|nr:glycosyltransferase family 2 protein [Burkholderiaceae bacterium]